MNKYVNVFLKFLYMACLCVVLTACGSQDNLMSESNDNEAVMRLDELKDNDVMSTAASDIMAGEARADAHDVSDIKAVMKPIAEDAKAILTDGDIDEVLAGEVEEADTEEATDEEESEDADTKDQESEDSNEDEEASEGDSDSSDETTQEEAKAVANTGNSRLIVIDAGHQSKGNTSKEPIGPGASEMKAKVAGGTHGNTSGLYEYQLTLMVAQKLASELTARGYQVQMVRNSNDVNMSNAERAQVANAAGAGAFIRIHANGSDNSSVNGAMTICQTPTNPYNSAYYSQSKKLSQCVLDSFVSKTGCKKQYVWETDTMSGINWCQVPVTIIEMGYMTNPTEDANMASDSYQKLMVEGMADGIDAFFN